MVLGGGPVCIIIQKGYLFTLGKSSAETELNLRHNSEF